MPSRRVVSLIASSTEMVCALGCGDRLVGRSHECDHPPWVRRLPAVTSPKFALDGSSYRIDQRVRAIVEQGVSVYRVDAAALAALEPDLIVTQTQCEVCAVSPRDLEAAAFETLGSQTEILALEPNRLEEIWRDVHCVARALGVPESGEKLVTHLMQRMRQIAKVARRQHFRPRTAVIEWIEPLMAAGNWHPELVEMAGGLDLFGAAGRHAPGLEWSALRAADPDLIIVAPCGFDLRRTQAEMAAMESRPGWGQLRALREGRIVLADGNAFFNRPGPRVLETLEILAEVIHPDAFAFGHQGTGWIRHGAAVRRPAPAGNRPLAGLSAPPRPR